jgi:hypothetical protein
MNTATIPGLTLLFVVGILVGTVQPSFGNGMDDYPTVSAKQIDYANNDKITVTDAAQQRDFVYVTIRFPTYDEERECYFLGSGTKVKLNRKDKTTFETVYHSEHDGVHGTTARVEYVFNLYPKSHNDYTRSVVTEVTFSYH